jgi:hypothetical protein
MHLCVCGECSAVFACYSITQVEQILSHECNSCEEGAVEYLGSVVVTQNEDVARLAQH